MKIKGIAPAIEKIASEMKAFREGAQSLELFINRYPFHTYISLTVRFKAGGTQEIEIKP